jgi:Glycosyltransferase family 87
MTTSLVQRARRPNPRVTRLAVRGLMALMLLVAVSHFAWVTLHHVEWLTASGEERFEVPDYVAFYAAGQLVMDGEADQIYDLDAIANKEREVSGSSFEDKLTLPYFNPPFVAVLIAPLSELPLAAFAAALFTINLALLIGCGLALQRLIGLTQREHVVFFWLAFVSTMPVWNVYLQHQLTLFVVAAWLGFVWLQIKGREGLSGAALTLGLVKPPLIAFAVLYMLYQRQWRALGSFCVIAGALMLLAIAVAGPQVLIDYPRFLIDSTKWVETNGVQPFYLFGLNGLLVDLLQDQTPPLWLLWPLTAGTLTLAFSTWRGRTAPAEAPLASQGEGAGGEVHRLLPLMAVGLVASVLVDQHLYLHDMLLVSLAIGFAAAHTMRTTGSLGNWGVIASAMWLCHLPVLVFAYKHGFPLFTLSTLALFGLLVREAWRIDAAATSSTDAPSLPDTRAAA